MLRQPRRRPKVAPSGTYNDGWSDADNAALQKLLQPLRHDPPDIDPLGCFGSEARGLACASRDMVYDRTMSFLSTLNVMSGLRALAAYSPSRPLPARHGGAARGTEAADGRRVQRDGVCRGDDPER